MCLRKTRFANKRDVKGLAYTEALGIAIDNYSSVNFPFMRQPGMLARRPTKTMGYMPKGLPRVPSRHNGVLQYNLSRFCFGPSNRAARVQTCRLISQPPMTYSRKEGTWRRRASVTATRPECT